MILTLIIVAGCFCSTTLIVSLMVPFHKLNEYSPFASAYEYVGFDNLKYVATFGTITTISARYLIIIFFFFFSF